VTLTDVGRYPIFVLAGLIATALVSAGGMVRSGPPAGLRPSRPVTTGGWRALGLVLAAAVVDLVLLDSAGFVVASTFLFWLTARAFDAAHPVRDLAIALALSAGAYLLFVGLLQLSLPPGPFGGSR
jgi:putative tricarboxylic transport membrane protein